MFESSQYDSGTNISGGGGGVLFSSQLADAPTTSAKRRDNQAMYPVTVKRIIEATLSSDDNSSFLIDGVSVYNVKLIGMVFDKAERVTDISFVIDDGTGRIGCNRWMNDPQDTKEVEGLVDGMYVRVHGHLKNFKGKKEVVLYAIRPVNDYNEIANHFLECVHAHCLNAKSQPQNNVIAPPSASMGAGIPRGHQPFSSTQMSQEYNLDGLGNTDKVVLDYLQLPSSLAQEKGVHKNELAQKLKISHEKIQEAIGSLELEGLIYSTIDENHYKSTAS